MCLPSLHTKCSPPKQEHFHPPPPREQSEQSPKLVFREEGEHLHPIAVNRCSSISKFCLSANFEFLHFQILKQFSHILFFLMCFCIAVQVLKMLQMCKFFLLVAVVCYVLFLWFLFFPTSQNFSQVLYLHFFFLVSPSISCWNLHFQHLSVPLTTCCILLFFNPSPNLVRFSTPPPFISKLPPPPHVIFLFPYSKIWFMTRKKCSSVCSCFFAFLVFKNIF